MRRIRFRFSFLTAVLAGAVLGCSGGGAASSGARGSGSSAPAGRGTGTVQVLMTASHAPDSVQSLVVTFDRVTVYPAGGGAMPLVEQGPVDLALNNASLDLMTLTGGAALLASGVAVNGDYNRVEVSASSAYLTFVSGKKDNDNENGTMRVRENVQDVPASFTVTDGGTVQVVLDFDIQGSVDLGKRPTLQPRIDLSSVR